MIKLTVQFFTRITILLVLVFGIHVYILSYLGNDPYANKIILSYVVNFLLAAIIFLTLGFLRKKYNDQLGFLFMVGSFLKFAAFFIFFSPAFKADGVMSRLEFFSFFIPYLVCLFTETLSIKSLLEPPLKKQ